MNKDKINITTFFKYNNTNIALSNEDIRALIYLDNLQNIYNYSNYEIKKECYFSLKGITQENFNMQLTQTKQILDNYRIYINKYTTNKIIEKNYTIEKIIDTLTKTNNCYIDEKNNLCLDNIIIISSKGDYNDILAHISNYIEIYQDNPTKIIEIVSRINQEYYSNIKKILKILNKDSSIIEIINSNTFISNKELANIKNSNDINIIRYILSLYSINEEISIDFNKILTNNSPNPYTKIENTIIEINTTLKKQKKLITREEKYQLPPLDILNQRDQIIKTICQTKDISPLAIYVYNLSEYARKYLKNIQKNNTQEKLLMLARIKDQIMSTLKILNIIPKEENGGYYEIK